jgi:hypothetical protein
MIINGRAPGIANTAKRLDRVVLVFPNDGTPVVRQREHF